MAVALAEEMPVNETIDLEERAAERWAWSCPRVLVNGVLPERFTGADAEAMASVDGAGSPAAREALTAALARPPARARASAPRSRRLKRGVEAPVATLPFLLTPEVELEDLESLSRELERKL